MFNYEEDKVLSQDELVARLVEAEARNKELVSSLFELKLLQDKVVEENFELRSALELTTHERNEALHQLSSFRTSDAYFKARIEEAERLKRENSDLGMQVLKANARTNDIERDNDSLRAEVERLKRDNENLRRNVIVANVGAQEFADSYERLKADTCDYEWLLKENEKLIKANTKFAKENEEYRCENVLLQNHVSNIASQIEELEKEVRSITKRKHSA